MAQYNSLYYVNGKIVSKEEFDRLFDADLEKETSDRAWKYGSEGSKLALRQELSEGYEVILNGNSYRYGEEYIYNSVLEFIGDYVEVGIHTDELLDALLKMPEESLKQLALMLDGVTELENGNLRYDPE